MSNISEAQNIIIENWITKQIQEKEKDHYFLLLCQNTEKDHRFYQASKNLQEYSSLIIFEVKLEIITPEDVDYWMLWNGYSIPNCTSKQISAGNQTQYILLNVQKRYTESFRFFDGLPDKVQSLTRTYENELLQVPKVSRKKAFNSTCLNLNKLQEWNRGYPISLYEQEIKGQISNQYRGYISNKIRQEIRGRNYEEITISLYVAISKDNEIFQRVTLVNLYNLDNNDLSTYTKFNISINKDNTFELLEDQKYMELFKNDITKYIEVFSSLSEPQLVENFKTKERPAKFSILKVEVCGFISKMKSIGIYIGNNKVCRYQKDGFNPKEWLKEMSLDDFLEGFSDIRVYTFKDFFFNEETLLKLKNYQ